MKLRLLCIFFLLSSFFSSISPMKPHHHAADYLRSTTLVTRKDIEGRLLCCIRTMGSHGIDPTDEDPHYRGYSGVIKISIVIANQIAYLHHHNGTDLESKTELWDFSSYQEVDSCNYEECKKRVEAIVNRYHP